MLMIAFQMKFREPNMLTSNFYFLFTTVELEMPTVYTFSIKFT